MLGNIVYTPAPAAAVATSLTIGTTPIVGGTAGAVLFESTLNKVSENAGLNYTAGGVLTITSITQQLKVAYNAGNRLDLTVGITGNAIFALTGTSPVYVFTNNITMSNAAGPALMDRASTANIPSLVPRKDDLTTGFGAGGTGRINISTSGVDVGAFQNGRLDGSAGQGPSFKGNQNSQITPTLIPNRANLNTGIGGATIDGITFWVANVEKIRIDNNGNLGINTTTISAKLHVISTTEQFRTGYDSTHFASFTCNSTGALTITLTGTALSTFFTDKVVLGNTITLAPYTFATLPAAPLAGQKAYIIDALAPVYLAPAVGGGLIFCPVFYNGVNWVTC